MRLTGGFLFFTLTLVTSAKGAEPDRKGIAFFETKIRPVLVQKCYRCHSTEAKRVRGKLLLDTREGVLRGGESGKVVIPGNPKKSILIQALQHQNKLEMPPSGKLPANVIQNFVQWVEMGAPDPRGGKSVQIQRKIDLKKGREFWAFQRVQKVTPPKVSDSSWAKSDLDRFILAKLENADLKPAKDATPRLLARRIYFDLLGLPPTPQQIQSFEKAAAKDLDSAIGNLVDELLRSPQFGERWGRYWLDVARYAESNGNVENTVFPYAWRYRNYVIDSFNEDKPFPTFIQEQLAGDLMGGKTVTERNARKIATGFLALTSKPRNQNNPNFAMDLVADQIEVTTRGFLGMTVACARCHDHKFDPVPTKDYYAIAGVFTSSRMLYGSGGNRRNRVPSAGYVMLEEEGKKKSVVKKPTKPAEPQVNAQQLRARAKELNRELKKLRKKSNKPGAAQRIKKLTREVQLIRTQLRGKKNNRNRGQTVANNAPRAMGVMEGSIADCRVNLKGEARRLGESVARGVLQVAIPEGESAKIDTRQSGRLELAKWIGSSDNPLTARVRANRIWLRLFGEGIVRTPDNFGINGERPTHPQLLDWLATQFVQNGWSTKKLIRTIMLSRAYRMSSDFDAKAYQADPDNLLLWRKTSRRLDAEALRDSILAVSGKIDLTRPKGSLVSSYGGRRIQDNLSTRTFDPDVNYRSVYLPIVRNGVPEMLKLFDFADPSLVVGKRNVTSVPGQELYLMNSPFIHGASKQFAARLLKLNADQRVEAAYQAALGRPATKSEIARAIQFVNNVSTGGESQQAWASFCQALFVSSEFRYLD